MAPLEIRHRSVRPISAKHAQASRFLQQSRLNDDWVKAEHVRETAERFRLSGADVGEYIQPIKDHGIGADEIALLRDTLIARRSEEHTSELQSLMRIPDAVFCLKKKMNMNQST